jgi:3-hydroxyisobutyrate dehydrogenase-like beta-hydroxyacid dehydrogenase
MIFFSHLIFFLLHISAKCNDFLYARFFFSFISLQLPMSAASAAQYRRVMDQGLGDADFSAIVEAFRAHQK